MTRVVVDASALLAILNQERGAEKLTPELLSAAVTSAVNIAEVQGKLVSRGLNSDDAWQATISTVPEVVAFSTEQARTAGDLITSTRGLGLSLGDRACLALAMALKVPVYTADRLWTGLRVGVRIYSIR
jgi:PIN domain nuclease of toxin-antitoxin system